MPEHYYNDAWIFLVVLALVAFFGGVLIAI